MAGLDDGFTGEARLTPGFTVGYLEPGAAARPDQGRQGQRPRRSARGPGPHRPVQRRHGHVVGAGRRLRGDRHAAERPWRTGSTPPTRGASSATSRSPWTPCAARRRCGGRENPLRRGEAARGALPAAPPAPGPAPPGRADEPPRRRVGRVAGAVPGRVRRDRRRRHARPLLPRQRRASGSWSSTAGEGIPFSGNYSGWLEQKLERMARESKLADARQRTLARELEWVRMGARARQAKGKARLRAYEQLLAEAKDAKDAIRELEIAIPPGPRLGDTVIEVHGPAQGIRRPPADRGPDVLAAAAGIVGIIGPNGAGKTTLFRMIVGQEPPDGGTIEIGETVQLATSTRSRDDAPLPSDRVRGDHRRRRGRQGRRRARFRPVHTCRASTSAAPTSRSSSATLSGGERNRVHLAKLLQAGRQRPAPRRADQRPRRRHAARARGGPRVVSRLRRRHQPRPLVPGPDRDPHPGLRGRQPGPLVRGQRQRLRGATATRSSARRPTSRIGSATSDWLAESAE